MLELFVQQENTEIKLVDTFVQCIKIYVQLFFLFRRDFDVSATSRAEKVLDTGVSRGSRVEKALEFQIPTLQEQKKR